MQRGRIWPSYKIFMSSKRKRIDKGEKKDLEAKAKAAEEAQIKKDEEELFLKKLEAEEQAKQEQEATKMWERFK